MIPITAAFNLQTCRPDPHHPLAYIDPDGRFVWLLAPIAISLAAEYCLPAAVVCLEPYVCAEFGGFLTGLVNGFNTNFFESAAAETLGYHNLGMAIGTALNLLPGKNVSNIVSKGGSLISNVATKELSAVATNTIATKSSKWFSWFRSTTAPAGQTVQKTARAAEQHLLQKTMPSLDALSQAGQVMDRGGLTKAGRALEKHSNRSVSVFQKVSGNASNKNMQAQYHLDNILTHPASKINKWKHRDFGKIIDIEVPGQGGARFYENGDFIGLLEPQKWIPRNL